MTASDFYTSSPRKVPISILIRKFFLNMFFLIGLGFISFGVAFFLTFYVSANYTALDYENASLVKQTQGKVIDLRQTNASINQLTVIEVIFEFNYLNKTYRSRSYGTSEAHELNRGSEVLVEFLISKPQTSRIKGMRSGKLSPVVFFISGIFPTIGLFFALLGTIRTIGLYKILRYGELRTASFQNAKNPKLIFNTPDGSQHFITLKRQGFSDCDSTEVLVLPNKPSQGIALIDLQSTLKSF